MFSKQNSEILSNNPNSMFKIGKKLSNISLKNISSLDNPSENPDMQLPLKQLNSLNNFSISKANNVIKNVDMDEFVSYINEADKTLQTISIIVNNIDSTLKGGSEKDLVFPDSMFALPDSKPSGDDVEDEEEDREDIPEEVPEEVLEEEKLQLEVNELEEYIAHELSYIDEIDREIDSYNRKDDFLNEYNFLYFPKKNNNDELVSSIKIYINDSNSKDERKKAEQYIKNILNQNDFNKIKKLKDEDNIYDLPDNYNEYMMELEINNNRINNLQNDKKKIQKDILKYNDEVFNAKKKIHEKKIEKERSSKSTTDSSVFKTSNNRKTFNPSNELEILKSIQSVPKNTTPSIRNTNDSLMFDNSNRKTFNPSKELEILKNIESIPKNIPSTTKTSDDINDIQNKIEDLTEKYESELEKQKLYDLPDGEKIIKDMKIYHKSDKNNIKTRHMNNLKEYLKPMNEIQIRAMIPDNISSYKSKSEYEEEKNSLEKELNYLKSNLKLAEDKSKMSNDIKFIDYIKSKEPIINAMSKFNSQMNKLFIFYKGKIKPNLKLINKNDISEALNDMNILYNNFKDVYIEIESKFHNVFGVEKFGHKKADQFLETFASNFNKIAPQIITELKAYSNISSYINGGFLMSYSARNNIFKGNKYLL